MKTIMALFTKYRFLIFVVATSLLASWPLLHAGLIPTHDGEYHLIRFYEFDKILRSGNWYPRWAPDLDFSYGLPLFTYVYPLPNYIASLLHLFGASFLDSVKLNMVLATIVGGIFFYLWTRRFWGNLGAVVSSIFYTFSPYHFVDIYVRGSVGEVWALGIFPAFLWTYTEFLSSGNLLYAILAAVLLALTILSHNILGLMFFIFGLTYAAFLILQHPHKIKKILMTCYIILVSLGLSAVFWLPALFETQFVQGLQVYNIAQNFPDIFQLLFPSWGTGFFDTNLSNQMSVQIGAANLFAIGVGLYYFVKYLLQKNKQLSLLIGFFLAWFVMLFLFMLPLSLPLWNTLPLIHYFQFPWRLLSLMIIVCSFLAGLLGYGKKSPIVVGIIIAIVIAMSIAYTQPAYYMLRNDRYYTSRSNFIDSTNSPGNSFNTIWNTTQSSRPKDLFVTTNGVSISHMQKITPTQFIAVVTTTQKTQQLINISYFPGWQVQVDNHQVAVSQNKGLITFPLPKGQHTVSLSLQTTPLEKVAESITILSVLIVFFLFFWKVKWSTLKGKIWEN